MRKRVLVCGGRDYENLELIKEYLKKLPRDSIIITGGAPGADKQALVAARVLNSSEEFNFWIWECFADWTVLSRAAGPIRNQAMIDEAQPHLVIAFPGGNGTMSMVGLARLAHIEVIEVKDE